MFKLIRMALVLSVAFVSQAFAYGGGGGGTSSCSPPFFSKYNPPKEAVVSSLSTFSFQASPQTWPTSIKVMVKDQAADIKTTKKSSGAVLVEGTLPEPITEGAVLLKISAQNAFNCSKKEGWLIKIDPNAGE
ncbi:MAG: hypothetical protein ABFS02_07770 [Pseudomonadota bacterium]